MVAHSGLKDVYEQIFFVYLVFRNLKIGSVLRIITYIIVDIHTNVLIKNVAVIY